MACVKYIADGFLLDATKLINEFSEMNVLEFPAFAEIWRTHNFSFIYAKRENAKELGEFTQEIFQLTFKFISSSTISKQVGGVFLLYALHLNQILEPKIKIRVTQERYQSLISLRNMAQADMLTTLHYTIDYLFENSFLVAFPTLMGPCTHSATKKSKKNQRENNLELNLISSNIAEIGRNGLLGNLKDTFIQYASLRRDTNSSRASHKYQELLSDLDGFIKGSVTSLSGDSNLKISSKSSIVSNSSFGRLGTRRTKLKANQFSLAVNPYKESTVNKVVDKNAPSGKKNMRKKSRVSKSADDEESDSSLINLVRQKFPKRTRVKVPRTRRYYEDGPFSLLENATLSTDLEEEMVDNPLEDVNNLTCFVTSDIDDQILSEEETKSETESVDLFF